MYARFQTGQHRHFVYDEEFELGKRHAHHLECLFGELPVASSSALVLNGQLQQSMDRDTTDVECCQSCGSGDGTQCGPCFLFPHLCHKCSDSLDQERLARTTNTADKHLQWFQVSREWGST